ncbi:hypothetical protein BDW62DRAFT_174400 [Aspergillus aurantiobrunneus]
MSLDGYCVQEDFDDEIASRLPPDLSRYSSSTLSGTSKSYRKVKLHAKKPAGKESCRRALFWKTSNSRFEQVNHMYSRIWRCLTTRLCTSMYNAQTKGLHLRESAESPPTKQDASR